MSAHTGSPEHWFGDPDNPSDRSYFHVSQGPDGFHPDWETQDFGDTRHVPGSDDNDIYDGGAGPDEITLTLRFDTREDYRAFRSRIKTTGTLQLLAGFTSIPGVERHDLGCDYERYAPVYLRRPQRVLHRRGGIVDCDATFVLLGGG
jgi:hypothetical protein